MNRPDRPHGDDATTRIGRDSEPTRTNAGADVTGRMAGTDRDRYTDRDEYTDRDGYTDRDRHADRDGYTDRDRHADRDEYTDRDARPGRLHREMGVGKLKTSAAATFALVFGVAALFTALTAILAPVAVVLGLIGIILGIAGIKMSRRPGVTGKGVAIGGLITALLAFLLGAGVIAGAAVFVNDEQRLDQLQGWIDDARANLPSGNDVVEQVPGG